VAVSCGLGSSDSGQGDSLERLKIDRDVFEERDYAHFSGGAEQHCSKARADALVTAQPFMPSMMTTDPEVAYSFRSTTGNKI
jgi:hypothetical protein